MESFKRDNKGFTLVELLVAMSIFVVFLGVLMSSYTSIIRAQHEANNYRVMYSEARHVFETITQELRNGMVGYDFYNSSPPPSGGDSIEIIDKSGLQKTIISFVEPVPDEGIGRINYKTFALSNASVVEENYLNSDAVSVDDLSFYVYPSKDPYNNANVDDNALQFQPMITVSATFSRNRTNKEPYFLTLQTTISSRIYNQINR